MGHLILFHVIGASVWLGGHLILAIGFLPPALRKRDPGIIAAFEAVYEKIGIPALLLQIVTGIWIAVRYLGNLWNAFHFSTPAERYIAWKLILLLLTVLIAAHARIRLITRLKEENMNYLAAHILAITLLALAMAFLGVGVRIGSW